MFYYHYYYYFTEFFTPSKADGFSLELKRQQVSSCLRDSPQYHTDFNNTLVLMVSTRPLISKSSCCFTNLLVAVSSTSIYSFSSLARFSNLSLFSFSFMFTQLSAGTAKFKIQRILFLFFVDYHRTWFSRLIRRSVCISKSQRILCVPFSLTDSGFCMVPMRKFKLIAQFSVDQLPYLVVPSLILLLC